MLRNPMTTSPEQQFQRPPALQKKCNSVTSTYRPPPSLSLSLAHVARNQHLRFILIARNANKSEMVERHTKCIRNENNEIQWHSFWQKNKGDREKANSKERKRERRDEWKEWEKATGIESDRGKSALHKWTEMRCYNKWYGVWRAQKCNEYKTRSRILEKHVLTLFRFVYSNTHTHTQTHTQTHTHTHTAAAHERKVETK